MGNGIIRECVCCPRCDTWIPVRDGAAVVDTSPMQCAVPVHDCASPAEQSEDLRALAAVGDLYLRALDDDPANERLTLGAAIRVTEIRQAVERQGYDVRWDPDPAKDTR